jgi:2-iminobutanoate/2-iminopropanoate deaminase
MSNIAITINGHNWEVERFGAANRTFLAKFISVLFGCNPMSRTIIQTPNAPAPVGPYNQAIACDGQMLFVSGQIALDPATGALVGDGDVVAQTEQVMANLQAVLKAGGSDFAQVVKTQVFLKDMNDFATVNGVYAKYFDEATAPARACVEVARLPKDVLVEIDCIALVG